MAMISQEMGKEGGRVYWEEAQITPILDLVPVVAGLSTLSFKDPKNPPAWLDVF
jgi:hypothetical protein